MAGKILYNNLLRDASIVLHSMPLGFEPGDCVDGRTSTFGKFQSGFGNGITFNLGSQKTFDTVAVARHNFDSGVFLTITGSNNGVDYTYLETSYNSFDEKNVYIDLGSQTYQYVQFVTNNASKEVTFADVFIGPSLDLERSQPHGFTRPGLSDGDQIISNVTRGKELAGLTIKPGVDRAVFTMPLYSSAWLSEWRALRDTMKLYPIYIIWDTTRSETPFYRGEPAFYCWPTKSLPAPKYSKNINGYYDIRFDMSGFWK